MSCYFFACLTSFEIEYNMFKYKSKNKKNAYKLKEITKKEFMDWLRKQQETKKYN